MGMIQKARLLGVDPSPTGTAVVGFYGGVPEKVWFCTGGKAVAKKWGESALYLEKVGGTDEGGRLRRLSRVRSWFDGILESFRPEYVAFEDFIWANKAGGMAGIMQAELGGVLRLDVLDRDIKFRSYDPAGVKISYSGKGNADKDFMMGIGRSDSRIKNLGLDKLEKKDLNNVVDAVAVGDLLWVEIQVRAGEVQVRDLPNNLIRVFNRVTKAHPECLLDRPFVEFDPFECHG